MKEKCNIEQLSSLKFHIIDLIERKEWDDEYELHEDIIYCVQFLWDMLDWAEIEMEERIGMYAFLNSVDRYIYA